MCGANPGDEVQGERATMMQDAQRVTSDEEREALAKAWGEIALGYRKAVSTSPLSSADRDRFRRSLRRAEQLAGMQPVRRVQ